MERQTNQKTKRVLIISAVVLVLLIAAFVAFRLWSQEAQQAELPPDNGAGEAVATKTITIDVIDAAGNKQTFTIETQEEFLRGALEQENLIAGDESDLGMMVTTVNGITAADANQEWWCFTKNGDMLMTGVDTTPIADGDTFEITLTVGW